MKRIFHQLIVKTAKKYFRSHPEEHRKGKSFKEWVNDLEVVLKHELYELPYLLIGVMAACFGLNGFLIPNSFIDGGIVGISLIIKELFDFPLSILILTLNLPFLILAFTAISKRFAIKSIIGITLLSVAVHFVSIPAVTNDPILVAAFGGIFLGLGIGLAIRGGAIIDGTEVLAIYLSRKTSMTVGNVILIFNILIFLTGGYFLSVEIALYAMLTYFTASQMIDFVIDGVEEYMSVTIISDLSNEIREGITNSLGRGCTMFKGQKGFSRDGEPLKDTNIVYTIITRLEMSKLKTEIDKIDPNAFIIMASVKDAKGGMIKKKPIKNIH
ncbi:MAG: YitT family protein [Cyclobacteriaceae bacterium]